MCLCVYVYSSSCYGWCGVGALVKDTVGAAALGTLRGSALLGALRWSIGVARLAAQTPATRPEIRS